MNILFLAPQPFFLERGTPIAVRMAVETLARRGHSVDLLCYHEGAEVPLDGARLHRIRRPPFIHGVPVGPSWKKLLCDVYFLGEFLAMTRRRRYDVIHAVEEAATIAHLTRGLHRIPFIVDMDSSLPSQLVETFAWIAPFAPPLRALETRTLRASVGVVAVCKELARVAHDAGVTAPIAVVEDAAFGGEDGAFARGDAARTASHSPLREELGIDRRAPIVLYVGNLQRYQGVDLLVDAFAKTTSAGTLVVVGGDPARLARLEARAAALGLGTRVRFPGPRPLAALAELLGQADVLVSPRLHGVNTPMKIYSYLASGRAVVATEILSHTQVLTSEVAALAPPEVALFAAALDRVLGDATLRERLGAAGRALAMREYSRAAFDRKFLAFYDEVERRIAASRTAREHVEVRA